ncbi:TlpA family protein disulfide reductase [Adlercreutzia mucosicola]|uniref:TlpA family protein disulfide reductase n=1 Tax=Adlercreutzia mucosicola TaxID=580026 RepID=UPI00040E48CB|nr:TlpA disulfide reductase family protein [Adlercreutzia mucosicola]MCR2036012.1 TlpA family protein disulfide reductase [Adlercreutzia mucosicola]MEB1814274.1 TlpA family protein disulfide reductase [Adlercreutzia mucosicola]
MSDHENEINGESAARSEGTAGSEAETKTLTHEERGERIGEALAAAEQEETRAAATPEGQQADRRAHRGIIIAAVAFAVLLIGAGIAYNVLAGDEKPSISGRDVVTTTEVPTDDTSTNGNGANAAEGDGSGASDSANATAAPEFTMADTEGQTLTLADFRGKPVLLNFWASWCGPCASEMPAIQSAYEQYGDQIQFVAVNMTGMGGETETSALSLIQQNNYTFPVYFDVDSSAAVAFGVTSIPQTYLIDAEGNIIGGLRGAMSDNVLAEGIQMLLGSE